MEFQRRYDEEGRVAVLISPGFGAGWSSWGDEGQREGMLFDSRLVDFVLSHGAGGLGDYAESLGYTGYTGGASDVEVIWVEAGTRFLIEEYDGSESIRTFDDLSYVA